MNGKLRLSPVSTTQSATSRASVDAGSPRKSARLEPGVIEGGASVWVAIAMMTLECCSAAACVCAGPAANKPRQNPAAVIAAAFRTRLGSIVVRNAPDGRMPAVIFFEGTQADIV
jgi:hypothetical protein